MSTAEFVTQTLRLVRDDAGVVTLTLTRPDQLNALSFELVDDLIAALQDVTRDGDARVLIVTGAGRAFCAGADLGEFAEILGPDRSGAERNVRHFHEVSALLAGLPIPTVAAVNGPAVGGGAALALLCDLRVASPSAMLRINQLERGIVPDMGATHVLPRVVGSARAMEIVLLRKALHSGTLEELGLVSFVVEQHELMARAHELALDLAALSPVAMRHSLHALRNAHGLSLQDSLDLEAAAQGECSEGTVNNSL